MDILQTWLNQKGDNAATALADVLRGIGYDPDAVAKAVQGERKAKLLEELASVRKRAEAQGVTKGEWEAVEPKLDVAAEAAIVEEPK